MKSCSTRLVIDWILRLIAAAILAQTLFFKFTGAEESRYIFSTLGAEPWGRVATGVAELVAVVLLLLPRTVLAGAVFGFGLMTGAIAAHLFRLGLVVKNDNGLLFGLALAVLVCCAALLIIHGRHWRVAGSLLRVTRRTGTACSRCLH